MTTVDKLIETSRRHLNSVQQGEYNFLSETASAAATTLKFELDLRGINEGSLLAIGDEIVLVKTVTAGSKQATVKRGWVGSTAAEHTSGAAVEVQPRFPRFTVLQALEDEIRSWGQALYRTATITLTGVTTARGYDLTSLGDFYQVVDVRRAPYSSGVDNTWPRIRSYEVARNLPTATFASGKALFLHETLDKAASIQVTYTAPFDLSTFTSATNVVSTCGVPQSAVDIPPLGVAWRLLSTREAKRTFTEAQPDPRTADDVPAGATLRTAGGFKALRDQRLIEESDRLRLSTPMRW